MAVRNKKRKPAKTKLRQELFPYEYVIDFNGQKAAERCGVATKGAKVWASRILTKTNIQEKIKELQDKQKNKAILTVEELDRRCAALNRCTIKDFYNPDGTAKPIHELTDEQAACVKEVTEIETAIGAHRGLKLVDFHQTLRTGMQRLGMLKDGSDKLVDTFEKWLDRMKTEPEKSK